MQLLASRQFPVIDCQSLTEFIGHERLFRGADGSFLLHMSSDGEEEERIAWLSVRDAIAWLNDTPDQFGSFWELALVSVVEQQFQRSSSGCTTDHGSNRGVRHDRNFSTGVRIGVARKSANDAQIETGR
jgi:hypothetical protein